ncbi:hypothetical protein TNCV_4084921 [Trichonephila clavipes]|nr:hypothetical protein TNCV_4084921 [Trichonephila clavipes]
MKSYKLLYRTQVTCDFAMKVAVYLKLVLSQVEDGIDNRVDAAVDVPQPSGQQKDSHSWSPGVALQFDADGIQNVAGKERYPAYQEHTCGSQK